MGIYNPTFDYGYFPLYHGKSWFCMVLYSNISYTHEYPVLKNHIIDMLNLIKNESKISRISFIYR